MDLEKWKAAKKAKKLTIAEIAQRANLPIGSVQNIFAGYVPNPRIDTVEAIEKALGLESRYEWTDEEKALGVGRKATYLSEEEWEWLELRSEILSAKGEDFLKTLISMLKTVAKP